MITIVDFIGHSDKNGKPMGHPIKVINEMVDLLLPITDVAVAAPESHIAEIKQKEKISIIKLSHHVNTFSANKIENLKKKWMNLSILFRNKLGTAWFINVDFSLFLYIYLFSSKKKQIWITLCYNPLKGLRGWREYVIRSVLKRVDLVILTNSNFKSVIPGNTVFIPDYYYRDSFYKEFITTQRKDQIVCLGTMGKEKQLEEFVNSVKGLSIPVIIVGNFAHNINRYQHLKELAHRYHQISLRNEYIGNEEYYRLIAESKYVALPYDMKLYDERTSGILLESVFLRSIPVAPQKLLQYNLIYGLGYDKLQELENLFKKKSAEDIKSIINNNEELIDSVFSEKKIQHVLMQYIELREE